MFNFLPVDFKRFPNVSLADESGLLAVGGNLHPESLQMAFRQGIFPWYSDDDPICWYAPPERCVIFPEKIKVSKSMQQLLKSNRFKITCNVAFVDVIFNCANVKRKHEDGTWIMPEIQIAYHKLHEMGIAKSVEVWENEQLVGGLYGVEIGNIFSGESMFSLKPNASKAALIWLCQNTSYILIDCQIPSAHLKSMGAEIISREAYCSYLSQSGDGMK